MLLIQPLLAMIFGRELLPLNHQKTIWIGIKDFSIYGKLLVPSNRSADDISKYPSASAALDKDVVFLF